MLVLNGHVYLNGVWVSVNLKTNTKNACGYKRFDYMLRICLSL